MLLDTLTLASQHREVLVPTDFERLGIEGVWLFFEGDVLLDLELCVGT